LKNSATICWLGILPLLDDEEDAAMPDNERFTIVEDHADRIVRQRGQDLQDKLCREMPLKRRWERIA
jgi:hypothetical protein